MYLMLRGRLPFDGKTDEEIIQKTVEGSHSLIMVCCYFVSLVGFSFLVGKVPFDGELWEKVSQESKDLLVRMLKVDPNERITAAQAIQHAWFKKKLDPDASPDTSSRTVESSPVLATRTSKRGFKGKDVASVLEAREQAKDPSKETGKGSAGQLPSLKEMDESKSRKASESIDRSLSRLDNMTLSMSKSATTPLPTRESSSSTVIRDSSSSVVIPQSQSTPAATQPAPTEQPTATPAAAEVVLSSLPQEASEVSIPALSAARRVSYVAPLSSLNESLSLSE